MKCLFDTLYVHNFCILAAGYENLMLVVKTALFRDDLLARICKGLARKGRILSPHE